MIAGDVMANARTSARPRTPERFASRRPGAAAVLRLAAALSAAAAVAVFHVWSHTKVTSAGYRLGELQRAQDALRAERDRLEVEVATLRAPGRLEAFARARLGMAPPAPGAVVAGWAGEAVAGRAGRAGGEEGLRPAPVEPAARVRGATVDAVRRTRAGGSGAPQPPAPSARGRAAQIAMR